MGVPLEIEAQHVPDKVELLFTKVVQMRLLYHTNGIDTQDKSPGHLNGGPYDAAR
jgi:hypothetical protein